MVMGSPRGRRTLERGSGTGLCEEKGEQAFHGRV